MKSPTYSLRKLLTHAGCFAGGLLVGLVIWKAIEPSDAKAAASAKAASTAESRASDRRRERPVNYSNGTEILKAIAPHYFEPKGDVQRSQSMTHASYLKQYSGRMIEAANQLEPADDVSAAALSALEKAAARRYEPGVSMTPEQIKDLQELGPRLIHWLREDPQTALRQLSDLSRPNFDISGPIFAIMTEKGADAAISWMKQTDPPLGGNFQSTLAMFIGTSGDISQLEKLKETFTPGQWGRIENQLSYSWPFEKADELFNFALAQNSPLMAVRLANSKGKEGADWLMKQMNSPSLDPAFKESLMNSQEYRQIMRANAHLPLEDRLEVVSKSEPGKDREQLALEMGSRDVSTALDDASRDWRFAFRSGKVSFEEVYNAVAADLPELAAGSPDAIRLAVFKELAEENGPAAMQALAHTPEPDKWAIALKPTQWMFHGVDPQKFYDYLQAIPVNDPSLHQARFESWVWHTPGNLSLYSRDYVNWVQAMPEGIDREMAAVGILRAIGKNAKDLNLKSEVDALVRDPSLRSRIEAPDPVKK